MQRNDDKVSLDQELVMSRFERAAGAFDGADFAHREVARGLFDRLQPMTLAPSVVVDLGCGTGAELKRLEKRFPKARIVGVDFTPGMLEKAATRRGWLSRQSVMQADAARLPFTEHSVGAVFSNLLLPWLPRPGGVFAEIGRVLQQDGLFLFSTLGPDSLRNLTEAFGDDAPRVHAFADMHDIGDGLVRAGLRDPVLDVDRITIEYQDAGRLFADLSAAGARNSLSNRPAGLTGRDKWKQMLENLERNLPIRVDLEVVYGHAWGSGQTPGAVRVDANAIGLRKR